MSVKAIVKSLPGVKFLLEKKHSLNAKRIIKNNCKNYEEAFLTHSTSFPDVENALRLKREIVIGVHILEKGLSHTNFRPGFGREVIVELQNNIKLYIKTEEYDRFIVNNAISLLNFYHEVNASHGFDDASYVDTSFYSDYESKDLRPYAIKSEVYSDMTFSELAHKRHSVRCYERYGLEISENEIIEAVDLANTAPSACNRQATHVFVVKEKELMKEIETLHGGCKNFGEHASAFIFITSDLSLYSRNEVKIPSYDAGIYTMNLLYAFQSQGLYSCVLNGSFPGNSYKKVHEITSIPERYDINGLVAVYKIDRLDDVLIAASPRRKAEEVITFL